MNALFALVMLLPLLPLLAAGGITAYILSGQAQGDAGEPPTARLAEGAAWLTLLGLLGLDLLALFAGVPGHVAIGTWFASGGFTIPISFVLDGLSLGYATLVALIGLVSLRFSRHYLHREPGFHRYYILMCVFLAGMLLIVLSGNAVLTFVGWEFAGISSFLLIGYAYDRPVATGNALWAFITNRIGDAGFILGISLAAWWLGTVEWTGLANWAASGSAFDKITARLVLFGFLLAAVIKSAQWPFTVWISRALEGPTPSSAIFYGAVMIHAGVYLVLRLEPVLLHTPGVMLALAVVGALTALYGWLVGLVQTDVKSSLIFATTTQVGLMFLACGLGWFQVAAWHMALHTIWRAYQFLLAPSYMYLVNEKARRVPAWLAGRQWLYTAALQRFWLDQLAVSMLIRPTRAVARDMRDFDDNVLAHLVGMPARRRAGAFSAGDDRDVVIRGHGLAGAVLVWVAERLHRFESRLVMRQGTGPLVRAMRRAGEYLLVLEALLERPRYPILLVVATLVIIL
ncbi:MAG: proton-conducting transporter membrane subunit [Rhodocyclaceae bacterium]|jgi:NADH:ubiquinone oxidoreductase subunit 5 (subunit L)/multisubunit Na+/H+ antiporter MnhA subunit|nr:proton-conducting transporter membrane subunit [Rhodocyclaceae bacterium]